MISVEAAVRTGPPPPVGWNSPTFEVPGAAPLSAGPSLEMQNARPEIRSGVLGYLWALPPASYLWCLPTLGAGGRGIT